MKEERQARILNIISTKQIETQEQLAEQLAASGYQVTQATVSRDVKELGLIKFTAKSGKQSYMQAPSIGGDSKADRAVRILRNSIISLDHTANFIVVKTHPGGGNAVAAALDSLPLAGVMGTIAGDDTILIINREIAATPGIVLHIRQLLNIGT
ncbi:MAG: arginine repressor [Peptococcaceae bacterium]|nr:arginine repressor [Peptococcaceae bacterium]